MFSGRWSSLLVFLGLCYGVAATASVLTRPAIRTWYVTLAKPGWAPPNWAFPVVWTILYACMAVAGWLVWNAAPSNARTLALSLFAAQLLLNFLWSPVFFRWHRIAAGVAVIAALWLLILAFLVCSWNVQRLAAYLFAPYLLWVTVAAALNFGIWQLNPAQSEAPLSISSSAFREVTAQLAGKAVVMAAALRDSIDPEGFPATHSWSAAAPIRFQSDWQGENPDPLRETEVRLLWTPQTIFVRFDAHSRTRTVFPDSEPNGRRDQLWERDVAEVFLQPLPSQPRAYKEFEISPNGMWLDLNIAPSGKADLQSGLRRRVSVEDARTMWRAELAIPMTSLVQSFDAAAVWRVNFFRVEGAAEPRFYSAWQPTKTAIPNFHVPEAFGYLRFI